MSSMKQSHRDKGKEGEEIACNYLQKNGFEIIERNYHHGHAEVDIIAKDGNEIVFVEVKARKSLEYGDPEFAINKKKISQIKKVALAYLIENNLEESECRIDAVTLIIEKDREPVLNHYKNVTG